jgi:UPF0716 family protein affecting phage T7 exclusion
MKQMQDDIPKTESPPGFAVRARLASCLLSGALLSLSDVYILIKLTGIIGGKTTFLLLLVSVGGAFILLVQQFRVVWPSMRLQTRIYRITGSQKAMDKLCAPEFVFDVLILECAFILILIPGFLTDFMACVLCFPATRNVFKRRFCSKIKVPKDANSG